MAMNSGMDKTVVEKASDRAQFVDMPQESLSSFLSSFSTLTATEVRELHSRGSGTTVLETREETALVQQSSTFSSSPSHLLLDAGRSLEAMAAPSLRQHLIDDFLADVRAEMEAEGSSGLPAEQSKKIAGVMEELSLPPGTSSGFFLDFTQLPQAPSDVKVDNFVEIEEVLDTAERTVSAVERAEEEDYVFSGLERREKRRSVRGGVGLLSKSLPEEKETAHLPQEKGDFSEDEGEDVGAALGLWEAEEVKASHNDELLSSPKTTEDETEAEKETLALGVESPADGRRLSAKFISDRPSEERPAKARARLSASKEDFNRAAERYEETRRKLTLVRTPRDSGPVAFDEAEEVVEATVDEDGHLSLPKASRPSIAVTAKAGKGDENEPKERLDGRTNSSYSASLAAEAKEEDSDLPGAPFTDADVLMSQGNMPAGKSTDEVVLVIDQEPEEKEAEELSTKHSSSRRVEIEIEDSLRETQNAVSEELREEETVVEEFALDPDFDYDNVKLTPRFEIGELPPHLERQFYGPSSGGGGGGGGPGIHFVR